MYTHSNSSRFQHSLLATTCALACMGMTLPATAGDIVVNLEEPKAATTYSGIGNLRGWAVSSVGIDRVELYIDGVFQTNIPAGGSRNDVAAGYPGYPDSDLSGFSMAYAYLKLSDGEHEIRIRAIDNDGDVEEIVRTFSTSNFGSTFIANPNAVNGTGASVSANGSTITIDGLKVNGTDYSVVLNWSPNSQGLVFSRIAAMQMGGCVNVPLVSNGTIVNWTISGTTGGFPVNGFIETEYVTVSDIQAETDTNSELTSQGVTTEEMSTTIQKYAINNNLLYLNSIDVDSSVTIMGFSVDSNVSLVNNPAQLQGAAKEFCQGQTWNSPSVEQTVNTDGLVVVSNSTSHTGKVLSLNESVSVPAGTFSTVVVETDRSDGTRTKVWIDKATGVTVKQEDYDAGNNLVLTSVAKTLS
ncbi:MAG: hypothetical protein ACWA5Q_00495 [bacterium]